MSRVFCFGTGTGRKRAGTELVPTCVARLTDTWGFFAVPAIKSRSEVKGGRFRAVGADCPGASHQMANGPLGARLAARHPDHVGPGARETRRFPGHRGRLLLPVRVRHLFQMCRL